MFRSRGAGVIGDNARFNLGRPLPVTDTARRLHVAQSQEKTMKKELLAKLRETKTVTLPTAVVRALDDSELAAVVGGMRMAAVRSDSCSGGCADDCCD